MRRIPNLTENPSAVPQAKSEGTVVGILQTHVLQTGEKSMLRRGEQVSIAVTDAHPTGVRSQLPIRLRAPSAVPSPTPTRRSQITSST